MMDEALRAGFWGLVGGSALILGALLGYSARLPQRIIAGIMALGAGVLISAVAFELVEGAYHQGGGLVAGLGLAAGAIIYTGGNILVSRAGAKHRKRSGSNSAESQSDAPDDGLPIAIGALLDGIPESIVIGVSISGGGAVSVATVAAVFLSNVPEGLSSAAGMKRAGRGRLYVFGLWAGIAMISGIAALVGNVALQGASPKLIASITALAAGAILAMIVDTMVPEATEEVHEATGLIAAVGFFIAFLLSRVE